jgi:AcrR family transcriptional regulator
MNEKDIILKYAGDKFYKEGFNKISMDEIASQLHISKKTIYKYFPSKDILIEALLDCNCQYHLENEIRILSQNTNVIKKIVQMIQFHLNELSKWSEKWLSDLQIHKPELWNKYMQFKNDKYYTHFKKIFKQGKKEEFFKDIPLDLILNGIDTIVKGVLHTDFLLNSKLSLRQALDYSIDIFISGILTINGLKIYNREKKLLKLYKF